MEKLKRSVTACLWALRSIALLLLVLAVLMPHGVQWYGRLRLLTPAGEAAILVGFYLCMLPTGFALWDLDRLLRRIRAGQIFLGSNVRLIRRLVWHCAAVSLITAACACFYPPLLFITVIMAFLCLVIGVVANIMDAATQLREENDLTI